MWMFHVLRISFPLHRLQEKPKMRLEICQIFQWKCPWIASTFAEWTKVFLFDFYSSIHVPFPKLWLLVFHSRCCKELNWIFYVCWWRSTLWHFARFFKIPARSYPSSSFEASREVIPVNFSTLLSLILFIRVSRFISEKFLAISMTEEEAERKMLVNDQIKNHEKSSDDKEWWWRSDDISEDIYAIFGIKTERKMLKKFFEMFKALGKFLFAGIKFFTAKTTSNVHFMSVVTQFHICFQLYHS